MKAAMHETEPIIVEHERKLYILDPWTNHFTQPIKYRTAWPTGLLAADHIELLGQPVQHIGSGIVRVTKTGVHVRLEHGGETKPDPDACEERRIPQSPGTHEYRNGRWVR